MLFMRPPISAANPVIEIALEKIHEPSFYEILFPVNSPTEHDCLPDITVKVRPLEQGAEAYEIVTGVAQCRFARTRGERTIYALVKEMTESEARRYATDEVLRAAALATTRNTVQLLVAARDNETHGGEWNVERITGLLGVKKSTYTHAWSSLKYVCDELQKADPGAKELGLAELVALAIRRDFMPPFTALYTGRLSVDKFYRDYYRQSEIALERSRRQREAKAEKQRAGKVEAVNSESAPSVSTPAPTCPEQLITDGVLSFARAIALKRQTTGSVTPTNRQFIDQQLITLLEAHDDLETEIRHVCKFILKNLDSGLRPRSTRRRSARPAEPELPSQNAQLSFELQEPSPPVEEHESELLGDAKPRAA
jgi:hypothetical protein